MSRIAIDLPDTFLFSTALAVRIGDINYGNHLGNDAVLTLAHEARLQFLQSLGFSEMNVGGAGLIMADAAIQFKAQAFYGDVLTCRVGIGSVSSAGFALITQMLNQHGVEVARLKNGMVFFDYSAQKITAVPALFLEKTGVQAP